MKNLLDIGNHIRMFWVKIIWSCYKTTFKKIGKHSYVSEIPIVRGTEFVEIGDNFFAGSDLRIEAWDSYGKQKFNPSIIIGDNVTFTERIYLSCVDKIEIGDGTLFGRDVFVSDNSHGYIDETAIGVPPVKRPLSSKGPVKIGKNVWIGRQCTILSGVTIGDNAIIGANSLVNNNIPENAVVAGSPARIIRYLSKPISFSEVKEGRDDGNQ